LRASTFTCPGPHTATAVGSPNAHWPPDRRTDERHVHGRRCAPGRSLLIDQFAEDRVNRDEVWNLIGRTCTRHEKAYAIC
jgi:hypothetical protein